MASNPGAPRMPEWYHSSYRQYKGNDQRFLLWVHRTIIEIRLKSQSQGSIEVFVSPKVSFTKLITHIEEIAASDAVIPVSILKLLYFSIKLRKRLAGYFSPDADETESNRKHLYAIAVFTDAFHILKEAEETRSKRDGKGKFVQTFTDSDDPFALAEAVDQACAAFDEEELGGTSPSVGSADNEWIRDNSLIRSRGKAVGKHEQRTFPMEEYEFVMDDHEVETVSKIQTNAYDALECFITDVDAMRQYCAQVWKSVVPVGATSHIAASFVTNKAVQLVKEKEYRLLADFSSLNDMAVCYQHFAQVIMAGTRSIDDEERRDIMSSNLLNRVLYWTLDFVHAFGEVLDNTPIPVPRKGKFGFFDALGERGAMHPGVGYPYTEDYSLMGSHLPDIVTANLYSCCDEKYPKLLGTQGLMRDFKKFSDDKSRKVTFALLFACQMQVDSVLVRRRYLHYDLSVMRNLGRTILQQYEAFNNDSVKYFFPNMEAHVRPVINRSTAMIHDSIEVDHITDFRLRHGYEVGEEAVQDDAFWLRNSWLTANVIADASLSFYFAGVAMIGASGFVKSAMQLWNMLRQTNSLPLSDASAIVSTSDSPSANPKDHVLLFDHLIEVFGSQVFSGPPPKEKFLVSWQIMMGHRLEAFAQGKRQVKKGAVPKQALHATGKGILPTISEAYNMHEADYFAKDTVTDKVKRRDFEQKHPLAATLDLVNSELGSSAALPFQASFSNTRGPLININFFKVHQLCTKIFEELAIALNVNLETFVTCDLFRLTKTIAEAETRDGGRGFPMLLRTAADVVLRVAGDERVGAYVLRVEGDENLVL